MEIPSLSKFQKQKDTEPYTVDGVTYDYPIIGKGPYDIWYVWFKGGLDLITPSEYGLEPGKTISIDDVKYEIDSVIFIRTSKKGYTQLKKKNINI